MSLQGTKLIAVGNAHGIDFKNDFDPERVKQEIRPLQGRDLSISVTGGVAPGY
jgi:hypothetical protein